MRKTNKTKKEGFEIKKGNVFTMTLIENDNLPNGISSV